MTQHNIYSGIDSCTNAIIYIYIYIYINIGNFVITVADFVKTIA